MGILAAGLAGLVSAPAIAVPADKPLRIAQATPDPVGAPARKAYENLMGQAAKAMEAGNCQEALDLIETA